MVKVLGIDVSKGDICCHLLTEYPEPNPRTYWSRTSRKSTENFPRFYLKPPKTKGSKKKWVLDFYDYLRVHQPDYAVMEPTGTHYSKLWAIILGKYGVKVLWVSHAALSFHRSACKFSSETKSDPIDALALASYFFDKDNTLEDGSIDRRSYLIEQPEKVLRLRQLCLWHDHLDKITTSMTNYIRQRLSWQFPECAKGKGKAFIPFLANSPEFAPSKGYVEYKNKYARSVVHELGLGIDEMLTKEARWNLEIELYDQQIVAEIEEHLKDPIYERYTKILDKFQFSAKEQGKLISKIYPFEAFLSPGNKLWKERKLIEVKFNQYRMVDGKRELVYAAGDRKRTCKNKTRDKLKMRLGMGKKVEESGDSQKRKRRGAKMTRNTLYMYVYRCISKKEGGDYGYLKELREYSRKLESMTNADGGSQLRTEHRYYKIMARISHLLYREFADEFVVKE